LFSENDRLQLLSLLREVVIPSRIETIPLNLGEASHGKLKAAQWASLFLYYIPLVIVEILVADVEDFHINSNRSMIMENTSSLIQCTQIVLSKAVTKASIDQFELMYSRYIDSSKNIFKIKSFWPNHHYALHIPEMMLYWGPLLGVSEFAGERLIGMLQKVTVNNKNNQMDASKIRQFCQLQRLYAQFNIPEAKTKKDTHNSGKIKLSQKTYEKLLEFLREEADSTLQDCADMPYKVNTPVLLPYAIPLNYLHITDVLGISPKSPNNCVMVKINGLKKFGIVDQIYQITFGNVIENVVLLKPVVQRYGKIDKSASANF
ncbi:hypothetical protein CROQUDRAFT_699672, partial [Cronartium quercuum f. sp. fusiforme G11]